MGIEIQVVTDKNLLSEFVHLPEQIHKTHKNWLPNLIVDDLNFFNPETNTSFSHCTTILAIAYRGKMPAGRIMGIIHHSYNKLKNEKIGRFGFFDCYEDPEVAQKLLLFIEDWCKEQGMTSIAGPYGFSDKDPQGFLIEGFEDTPLISTLCNLPYMVRFTENAGYYKLLDCVTYRFNKSILLPSIYGRVEQRVLGTKRYKLLSFKKKSELEPFVVPILRLVNESYSELYGFFPLSETEMKEFAKRYMPVLRPKYVKVIMLDDEVAAFVVGIPNLARGLQRSGGRIFPFGWLYILQSLYQSKQLDLMLGAVKPGHQGLGLEVTMGLALLETARQSGIETIETHLILETNHKMRSVMERVGATMTKRFRVYQKNLS